MKRLNHYLLPLGLLTSLLLSPPLPAQQEEADSDEPLADSEVEEQEEALDEEALGQSVRPGQVLEDFVPSVQISEDLSVAFPVDI